jgi:hypothetical protein
MAPAPIQDGMAGRLPPKKLSAALGSYASEIAPAEVLALIDTTVFGGAKEGVLLTENGMCAKELMSACADFPWTAGRVNPHQRASGRRCDHGQQDRTRAGGWCLAGVLANAREGR